MITELRKRTKSIVVKILLALLVSSFALWGVGDIFSNRSNQTIASIEDQDITLNEFNKEYLNNLNQLQQQAGQEITPELAKDIGLHIQVLNEMINKKLIDIYVRDLNLKLNYESIIKIIANNPQFKDDLGQFNKDLFEYNLRSQGLNEKQYIEKLKLDLTRDLLLNSIFSNLKTPNLLLKTVTNIRNEKRSAIAAVFNATSDLDSHEFSETEINLYYEENKSKYMIPELRNISLASLRPADLLSEISVSENELKAEYENNLDQFIEVEKRGVKLLIIKDKEKANKVLTQLREGKDFNEIIINEINIKDKLVDLGIVTKEELEPEFAEKVFTTSKKEFIDPENTPFGWRIFEVYEIQPYYQKTYVDVKDELLKEIKTRYAIDAVYNLGNNFYDSLAAGNNLETAANEVGATFEQFIGFDLLGRDKEGNAIANLPPMPEFLEISFNTNINEISELIESLGNIMFAVRVDNIISSRTKSLEQSRNKVILDLKDDLIAKTSEDYAKKFIEKVNNGEDFVSTTYALNGRIMKLESFDRTGANTEDSVPLPVIKEAFTIDLNDLSPPIIYEKYSYMVIRLLNIIPYKEDKVDQQVDFDLLGTFQEDITDALITNLRNVYSVKINQNILQNF